MSASRESVLGPGRADGPSSPTVDGPVGDAAAATALRSVVAAGPPTSAAGHPGIVIGRYRGTVVLTIHGEIDVARAAELGAILADLIDGQGSLSMVIDLHDATATDPDSLTVLTDAAERTRKRGGVLRLCEPPIPLYKALELRGLDRFVGILDRPAMGPEAPRDGFARDRVRCPDPT